MYEKLQGGEGIAKLYIYGTEGDFNILVTELLGNSKESLFRHCNKHFSIATTLILTEQMVYIKINIDLANRIFSQEWVYTS